MSGTGDFPATVSRVWETLVHGDEAPDETVRPPELQTAVEPAALRTSSVVFSETLELAASPRLEAATRFDLDFEVMRVLGRGGMGIVYAARQAALDREVALKTPLADPARRPSVEQRFVAEAIVTAGLDHPNVVPVHELGRDEVGNLYMAMKLVRGTAWSDLLHPPVGGATRPFTLRQHVETLLRVCDAVAYAHSRGVVHRDLKPGNVMLGDYGEVLVMDWGLAVAFGEAASKRLSTSPRVSAGTPAYMPPEMATGDLDHIGPASDVYLLGAILYEVLTGSPPHRGANVWETLAAAARGTVEPPETRAAERAVPRELGRIALRALSADPAARHASVRELKEELQLFLAHEESLRLADEAARALEGMADASRAERYARYADVQTSLRQAIRVWPDNEDALATLALATERYAAEALERGDVGLAAAQAESLRGLPRADLARGEALWLAVARRQSASRRARLAAAFVLAALVAAAGWVASWRETDRLRREANDREAQLNQAVENAWAAARDGDVPRLTRSLVTVESLRPAPRGRDEDVWREEYERRTRWFPWVRQVIVWQQERWDEVAAVEPPRSSEAPRPSTFLQDPRQLCEMLLERQAITRSMLGRRVRVACSGRDSLTTDGLWLRLLEQARQGGDTAALQAADEAWQAFCADTRTCRETPGIALFRAAVWGVARDTAASRGDAAGAARAAGHARPFVLTAVPFGPPDSAGPRPRVRVARQPDSTLLALDATTGERLWQSIPVATSGLAPLPVADGSLIVANGSRLARLSGATGDVLGQAWLPADVQGMWPDPRDPSRLHVLVGYTHKGVLTDVAFDATRPAPPYAGVFGQSAVELLKGRYQEAARAFLGLEKADPFLPAGPAFVAERLRVAAERDPTDARSWAAVLHALGADEARRHPDLIERAVATARRGPPAVTTFVAQQLDDAGLASEADTLWDEVARAFQAGHGNADLGFGHISPAYRMRAWAGRLAERGELQRALDLVERSRRVGTFALGDTAFYRRYARWLRTEGREPDARRADELVTRSAVVGGTALLPDTFAVGLDIALLACAAIPPVLLLLVARSWLRSRAARHADLAAAGFRTGWDRAAAFLTHPFERAGTTFLAYASRLERAAIAGLGGLLLFYVCALVGGIAIVGRLGSEPFDLAQGFTSSDEFLNHVKQRLKPRESTFGERLRATWAGGDFEVALARVQGARPWTLRVLAESHRSRGETAEAAAALARVLELQADDSVAVNNLAVLAETQGRAAEARAGYSRAASLPGESCAVGRFNLARLDGDRAALDRERAGLPHRDRLAADHFGDAAPLWALVPARDLVDTMVEDRTLMAGARAALLGILSTSPPAAIRKASQFGVAEQTMSWAGFLVYLSWFFALMALVWLPLPVRLLPAPSDAASASRLRRLGSRCVQAFGFLLPGSWDLVAGRAMLGAVILTAFLLAVVVTRCVYEGGFISGMLAFDAPWQQSFFEDLPAGIAFPELRGLGFGAALLAGLLFSLNLVLMLRRVRGTA